MHVPPRSRGEARIQAERSYVVRRVILPAQAFIHTAGLSGFVLVAAATIALIWANSPWAESYHAFQHTKLTLDLGVIKISESLQHWVNDALMTFFFFVVGMEIKREVVDGELSDLRRASLPIIAAFGGMVIPALIYVAINWGQPTVRGWGIPMATDIAFALGVLALLGDRIPNPVRVLLLALAIVDDIGAILVIAVFYAKGISIPALAVAGALLLVVLLMRYGGIVGFGPYYAVGALLWLATFKSGVHATLAGVTLGLITPAGAWYSRSRFARPARELLTAFERQIAGHDDEEADALLAEIEELCRHTESPLDRLVRVLHPWTSFIVLPLFALVNAGVTLSLDGLRDSLTNRVTLGIALGLVLGKTLGIYGISWAAVKLGLARLPVGSSWGHILGVAMLAGIGFTVSLFIADLAFTGEAETDAAKIGILFASVLAGLLGFIYLAFYTRKKPANP